MSAPATDVVIYLGADTGLAERPALLGLATALSTISMPASPGNDTLLNAVSAPPEHELTFRHRVPACFYRTSGAHPLGLRAS